MTKTFTSEWYIRVYQGGGLGDLDNQVVAKNTPLFWFGIFCKYVLVSNLQDPLIFAPAGSRIFAMTAGF